VKQPLSRSRVLLVSAFDPWAVGNGSSMRARRWCQALGAAAGAFEAVVVPVVETDAASPYHRVALPDDRAVVAGAARLMQARWRDWMVRTAPLPPSASRAPAWMGRELLAQLPWPPDLVVAFKMAVAPLAADLAIECRVPLLVDLDDDEATLEAAAGGVHAEALERLLRGVGDLAAELTVASPADAVALRSRVAAPVRVAPNCVEVPAPPSSAGLAGRALYVANFGYGPNRQSAQWLRREVLPHVRGLEELAVVGAGGDTLGFEAPAVAHGRVAELAPLYRDAAVVVCPVLSGSGTSIKVVEALAHSRAVVTTSIGARGLGLVPDEHAVVCDSPGEFAARLSALLANPAAAAALGARGRAWVQANSSAAVGDAAMVAAASAALGVAL
jgi:glycosyltransferase involved in cell wall biosynthesis